MKKIFIAVIIVFTCTVFCFHITYGKNSTTVKEIKRNLLYNSEFAFNMFDSVQIEDSDKNIFISPYSISSALSMLYNGASGQGRDEMAAVLGYTDRGIITVNKQQLKLKRALETGSEQVQISVANSLWANQGVKPKQIFSDALKNFYDSEMFTRDFNDANTVNEINNWISDNTEGMIPKMLQRINPQCIMFLINAIYFKGIWSHEFDPDNTRQEIFTDYKGKKITVDMMHQKRHFLYLKTNTYKALRLPYGDNEAAMYIILPEKGTDINNMIKAFTSAEWDDLKCSMRPEELEVGLPKFTMKYGVKRLNKALQNMGMISVFKPGFLMNIMNDPRLFVEYVDHKAVLEVDEKGTEAAAATIISIGKAAYVQPKYFIADRPFFFIISDERTGTILFMGKLLYP